MQVGDLPPQRIPTTLQVVGSPLVLNKHRVQRQASEVLHTLMRHQQQLLKLPQAPPKSSSSRAAQGSDRGDALVVPNNAGCSDSSSVRSGSSVGSSDHDRDSKVSCSLDFGVVPAGMEVRQTFYASNSGAIPAGALNAVGSVASQVFGYSSTHARNTLC